MVSAAKGFSAIVLEGQTHSHGKGGEHSHAGIDPHVWMDPDIYRLQAEQVTKSLKNRDPDHAALYQSRFETISQELDALNAESGSILNQLQDYPVAANYPAYNYWMRRFELEIHSFDIPVDQPLNAAEISKAQAWIAEHPKAILVWTDEPSEALKSTLAGYSHLELDDLERPVSGQAYDYMEQYKHNLEQIQQFLSVQAKEEADAP